MIKIRNCRQILLLSLLFLLIPASGTAHARNADQSSTEEPDRITSLYETQAKAFRENDRKAAAEASGEILKLLGAHDQRNKKTYAFALNNHGMNLTNLGQHDEALPLFRESWEIYTNLFGRNDADTLLALNNYTSVLENAGYAEEAEKLYPELVTGRQELLGKQHPDTLVSMANYANFLASRGRYEDALPLSEEVVALWVATKGTELQSTLIARNNHAALLQRSGALRAARDVHADILDIRRNILASEDPDILISMNNLAFAEQALGQYGKAEPLFREALLLSEKIYGPEHPSTLISRNNQAALLEAMGKLDEAEPLYKSVLESRQRLLGPEHRNVITSLNNFAGILNAQGKFDEAEALYAQTLQLSRKSHGITHPDTVNVLLNYAGMLRLQNRLEEARTLYEEVLRANQEQLGSDHPDTLNAQNSLAMVLVDQRKVTQAEPLFTAALEGRRRVLGPEHPDTIVSLNNQAAFLNAVGNYQEAEPLYAEALALNRKILGAQHPNTITSISNYAFILDVLDRRPEAEKYYVEAVDLSNKILDERHPDIVTRNGSLAYVRLEQPERAPMAIEQARIATGIISARRNALGFSPAEQAQIGRDIGRQSFYFQLLADAAWAAGKDESKPDPDKDKLRIEAFQALQEAMASTTTRAIAQTAARNAAARTGGALGLLVSERETLTDKWLAAEKLRVVAFAEQTEAASQQIEQLRATQDELVARMKQVDDRLEQEAPAYFALVRPEPMQPAEAQALMADDEAALIIVPTAFGTHIMAVTDEGLQWHRSELTVVDIEEAVQRLLWDAGADIKVDTAKSLEWDEQGEGTYRFARPYAYLLYRELIAPVEPALAGKTHLFIAPSGSLTSLPFGLLVTEKPMGANGDPANLRATRWFADAYALTVVPSLQSLQFLRQSKHENTRLSGATFIGFGDPILDGMARTRGDRAQRSAESTASSAGLSVNRLSRESTGEVTDLSEIRNMARLPGTAEELRAIWKAFGRPKNALFLAEQATEARVKATDFSKAQIISFATHGIVAGELNGASEPGLIFTPPNKASETDDGLLTSSEVAGLRLNADWVILSACNTAAGDGSQGAPGLSGLARAFFFAGARNLLASHWPVRDDVAAKITVRTIEILNADQTRSRAQAFQQAMREIREDASRDTDGDSWAHPNAWAPFTLIGDR